MNTILDKIWFLLHYKMFLFQRAHIYIAHENRYEFQTDGESDDIPWMAIYECKFACIFVLICSESSNARFLTRKFFPGRNENVTV